MTIWTTVVIGSSTVADVSAVYQEASFTKFVVSLNQGNLPAQGVAVGDTVSYAGLDDQGASHSVQGVIDAVSAGQFTVRCNENLTQTPDPANHTFTIAHAGMLQHELLAALGTLAVSRLPSR